MSDQIKCSRVVAVLGSDASPENKDAKSALTDHPDNVRHLLVSFADSGYLRMNIMNGDTCIVSFLLHPDQAHRFGQSLLSHFPEPASSNDPDEGLWPGSK